MIVVYACIIQDPFVQ